MNIKVSLFSFDFLGKYNFFFALKPDIEIIRGPFLSSFRISELFVSKIVDSFHAHREQNGVQSCSNYLLLSPFVLHLNRKCMHSVGRYLNAFLMLLI